MIRRTVAVAGLAIAGLWTHAGSPRTSSFPTSSSCRAAARPSGAMWKNGSTMAVEEINAAGGILGKKIKLEFVDTASDPGKARAAMQRALDDKPIAIFGPIYSGSVSATLKLTADAEVPQMMAARPARSRRRAASTSSAPRSARTCRCPRSPTTCATA